MDYRLEDLPERADRRWPPFAAGGIALLLVFGMLPNPFNVPDNNPTASAEYAPVPGDTGEQQEANFSETSLATSSGLQQVPGLPSLPPLKLPPQFRPRQKPCFGSPPRQTEDPLSPPCVPFFAGDNGGATHTGVTGDTVTVVLYNDWGVTGDMTQPYKPRDEPRNFSLGGIGVSTQNLVRTIKAHLAYFQERFQTYGRRVHVIAQPSVGGFGATCPQRKGDAAQTKGDFNPFAALDFSTRAASCYIDHISQHGILNFGINWDLPREVYDRNAPKVFGFYPDQQTEAEWSAGFICNTLRSQAASFTHDPLLRGKPRAIGLIHPGASADQHDFDRPAGRLKAALRARCNFTFADEFTYRADNSTRDGGSNDGSSAGIGAFKSKGITTIVCYCSPDRVRRFQGNATSANYFPEWFFDHGSRMFRSNTIKSFTDASQPRPFGITHFWRLPRFEEQYHYQAFVSEAPGEHPNPGLSFDIYHQFLNLFTAIQSAGPRLTSETVRKGMFTFRYLDQEDAMLPTGGYGPYGSKAVSDYTFIDTAAGWWWDPAGTPPGGRSGDGCLRLIVEGYRFFSREWPTTDDVLFDDRTAPCTADVVPRGGSGPF